MNSKNNIKTARRTFVRPKISHLAMIALPILMVALGMRAGAQDFTGTATFTEWSSPINLGPPVNRTGFDGGPFISSDGLNLFITTNRPGGLGMTDIFVSHRATRDAPWGTPVSLGPEINSPFGESFPFLTPDGQTLYFTSTRPGGCGDADIYVSQRGVLRRSGDISEIDLSLDDLTQWQTPVNLGCEVNSPGVELAPSLFEAEDGTVYLYFSSGVRRGGQGAGDLYFAPQRADGTFGPVMPIVEFNTFFNDIRPTVRTPDGLEIVFDSNRPGSIANTPDLYTSTRQCLLCPWAEPVNMGPLVNSTGVEGGAKLSSDGTELYYMSNRPGTLGDQDIWVIRRNKLTERRLIF